ncbi:MAG: hypothetical protein ACLSHW_08540 [Lachnospiraceae bacterium]
MRQPIDRCGSKYKGTATSTLDQETRTGRTYEIPVVRTVDQADYRGDSHSEPSNEMVRQNHHIPVPKI